MENGILSFPAPYIFVPNSYKVDVRSRGVIPNNSSNNASALNALISAVPAGSTIHFGRSKTMYNYRIQSAFTIAKPVYFTFDEGVEIQTTGNAVIFSIAAGANGVVIKGDRSVKFIGNNSGGSQVGILVSNVNDYHIEGVKLQNWGAAGIQVQTSGSTTYGGSMIIDCSAEGCAGNSFFMGSAGDYAKLTRCSAYNGTGKGFQINGSNSIISDCMAGGMTTGIEFGAGTSNGKNRVNGTFNHNTTNILVGATDEPILLDVWAAAGPTIIDGAAQVVLGGAIATGALTVRNLPANGQVMVKHMDLNLSTVTVATNNADSQLTFHGNHLYGTLPPKVDDASGTVLSEFNYDNAQTLWTFR